MKIGILTLPLHTNYGGVLQAYALQYSLRNMEHEAYLIDCRTDPKYANIIKRPLAAALKTASRCAPPLAQRLAPIERQMLADKAVMRSNIEPFIKRHIPLCHFIDYKLIPKNTFDAIVVGSDQVWRPAYFKPISAAYLNFTRGWNIKRVVYAASFGVDEWEYNEAQTKECQRLATSFNAISVRESSGVALCKKHLNQGAIEVLDPTLLLSKEVYMNLLNSSSTKKRPSHKGRIMVHILDSTPDKETLIKEISTRYSAETFSVNSRVEDRTAPLNERIQPPIEDWIQGFIDADYVITDSYHATIFAIIFNKPFIAYGNGGRGYARFSSLLTKLGLMTQYIESSSSLYDQCWSIDWSTVNANLQKLKDESLEFLHSSLEK